MCSLSSSEDLMDISDNENFSEDYPTFDDNIDFNEDITVEDVSDLIDLIEDNSGLDPLSLQLSGFSSEDISKIFDIIESQQIIGQIDGQTLTNNNQNTSYGQSMADSSTSSSVINSSKESSNSSTNSGKSEDSVRKSGKQLRYLYKKFGLKVNVRNNSKNSKNVFNNEFIDNIKSRLRSRNQTIIGHKSVDNESKDVIKRQINGKNRVDSQKSKPRITTTIIKCVADEGLPSVSDKSNINKEFVKKLCHFLKDNKRRNSQRAINSEFLPFLPEVRVERLTIKSKELTKSPNSLLKDRIIRFRNRSAEKWTKFCPHCDASEYRPHYKMMSTYLKDVFKTPEKSNKRPVRVRVSKNLSYGVRIRFHEVLELE